MILHVTFIDGSNPWAFYGPRETLLKQWKRWEHIPQARPEFICGDFKCLPVAGGGWAVGKYFDGAHTTKYYEYLGNALKALEVKQKCSS